MFGECVMTELITFFTDGYIMSSVDDSIDISVFDGFEFPDCNDLQSKEMCSDAENELNRLHRYFADNWVRRIFSVFELKNNGMWFGVDSGSDVWHNDYKHGLEHKDVFNSNILLYLNDNTEENGNNIQVRSVGGPEITLYPKRGDFVWLNQKKCFEHRAICKTGPRRLLSFEYMIPALL